MNSNRSFFILIPCFKFYFSVTVDILCYVPFRCTARGNGQREMSQTENSNCSDTRRVLLLSGFSNLCSTRGFFFIYLFWPVLQFVSPKYYLIFSVTFKDYFSFYRVECNGIWLISFGNLKNVPGMSIYKLHDSIRVAVITDYILIPCMVEEHSSCRPLNTAYRIPDLI